MLVGGGARGRDLAVGRAPADRARDPGSRRRPSSWRSGPPCRRRPSCAAKRRPRSRARWDGARGVLLDPVPVDRRTAGPDSVARWIDAGPPSRTRGDRLIRSGRGRAPRPTRYDERLPAVHLDRPSPGSARASHESPRRNHAEDGPGTLGRRPDRHRTTADRGCTRAPVRTTCAVSTDCARSRCSRSSSTTRGLGGLSGRLPRRRGLLRHQRLPDHGAPAGRAPGDRPDRPDRLLAPSSPAAAAGALLPAGRDAGVRRRRRARTRSPGCGPDALAAFAYVTNWHLIAGDQSYFESIGRPSLFLHLWSLAIEEQFYLVWPLVLGVAAARRAGASALAVDPSRRGRFGGLDGAPVRPGQRSVAGLLRHRHPLDRAPARRGPRVRLGPGGRRPALAGHRAEPAQAPAIAGQGSRGDALGEPAGSAGRSTSSGWPAWSG